MSSNQPIQLIDNQFTPKEINLGTKVLDSPIISADARRWLIRALDPFHDTEVTPAGYPDFEMSATVVQEVNLSMTVVAPYNVTTTWDAHIFNAPDFASKKEGASSWGAYDLSTGAITDPLSPPKYMPDSGVIAAVGVSGSALLPDISLIQPDIGVSYKSVDPYDYITAQTRVVGFAFEVINTTATIYQQGLATAYRMPQINGQLTWARIGTGGATSIVAPEMMVHYHMPPSTSSEALTLPSSKQWPASKGAYSVCTMTNENNTLQSFNNLKRVWLPRAIANPGQSGAVVSDHPAQVGGTGMAMTNRWHAPYNTTGVYFSGLSPQTTLQVNVKYLLESAPGPRSALATLAHPSPSYDAEAIRLYTLLASKMPVGVPFDENPSGEWFTHVMGVLGTMAGAASAIHPLFGALQGGLGVAQRLVPQVAKLLEARKQPPPKDKVAVKVDLLSPGQRRARVLAPVITKKRKG